MSDSNDLDEAIAEHDARVSELGLDIWLGAEPTFTLRESQDPWWLGNAEGGDKLDRAKALLRALATRLPGEVELRRVPGRQFPEEPEPRFALAAIWQRHAPSHESTPPGSTGLWSEDAVLEEPPGATPHVDENTAYLTVTPDPGVVEVNMAPAHDLGTFARWMRLTFAAAEDAGLSPFRYLFNGEERDSGGGGQVTLGGPSPSASPFFRHPQLLPGLLRYLNRHPALSYWFAGDCVGSASQGPRADEGTREAFEELALTLDRLAQRGDQLEQALLWNSLAPLLVDSSGNTHRAEVNIEKLYNPHLPGRGMLGLVELRSLRMEPDSERAIAVAGLWRALAARLAAEPFTDPLRDWGSELHDRYGLPTLLLHDLKQVLADLDVQRLCPGGTWRALLEQPPEPLATVQLGDSALTITPARDFWPLMGDVASQERSTARSVDASTARIELSVRGDSGCISWGGWRLPLEQVGSSHIGAVRYRRFVPQPGLHPDLSAHDPVELVWQVGGAARRIALHGWRPDGGGYDGLPSNAEEARARRRDRVVSEPTEPIRDLVDTPSSRLSVDLRGLLRRGPAT